MTGRMRSILFCSLFFMLPTFAQAAVTFSEIAWMGSLDSANYEWIELHNDGSAVDVTGWVVRDGMSLDIALSGEIPENSTVVLERTSDDSALGTAFLIYTGALVNTGVTLQLVRVDGSIEDQVSGGVDWQEIGGDNVTKETAQYTSGGWVTAAATPGRLIAAAEVPVAAAAPDPALTPSPTTAGESVRKAGASEPVVLTLPDVTLQLDVKTQSVGYVHQPIKMDVKSSGIGDTLIDSLQYEWNFGDGETAVTKEVTHVYEYPGTYVITVYGGFKRQEQVARYEITILPVTVSLTMSAGGDVQVNNDSPYEIDLSGYRIKATSEFTFPPRTVLLPNQTITISHKKLGSPKQQFTALYDTERALVASLVPGGESDVSRVVTDLSPTAMISAASYTQPKVPEESQQISNFTFAQTVEAAEQIENAEPEILAAGSVEMNEDGIAPRGADQRWPYYALAVVILLGTLGIYATPRRNENP